MSWVGFVIPRAKDGRGGMEMRGTADGLLGVKRRRWAHTTDAEVVLWHQDRRGGALLGERRFRHRFEF